MVSYKALNTYQYAPKDAVSRSTSTTDSKIMKCAKDVLGR